MSGPRTGTLYWLPRILDDTSLDAVETLLMIGLADHVNADDECHVGIVRLAERARCSYGTARRRLAALEARGRLTRARRRRDDGNLSTYLWTLVRDEPARSVRDDPARALVSADQRASGRAVTSAHQEARAEVPTDEPPSGEPHQMALVVPDVTFPGFWELYPKRNGKRLGRGECETAWLKLKPRDVADVMCAVVHYADACNAGATIAKDPIRWLRGRCWSDWMEPADLTPRPGKVSRIDAKLQQLQQSRQPQRPARAIGDGR